MGKIYIVENCSFEFEFKCPRQFEDLERTGDEKIRDCDSCKKQVFLCDTKKELKKHVKLGHCVAFKDTEELLGYILPPDEPDFQA